MLSNAVANCLMVPKKRLIQPSVQAYDRRRCQGRNATLMDSVPRATRSMPAWKSANGNW